jgi:hypothetical protein
MRKLLVRVALVGAAAGAALAVRNYLRNGAGTKPGDVQIVLNDGATTIEPDPVEAREFADIARKVVEAAGG